MASRDIRPIHDAKQTAHVIVIMTIAPGKMAEFEAITKEGYDEHSKNPNCLFWHVSKTVNMENIAKGWTDDVSEGEIILSQEWTSLDAFLEHGKTEEARKVRDRLAPLFAKPPMLKVSKSYLGFRASD